MLSVLLMKLWSRLNHDWVIYERESIKVLDFCSTDHSIYGFKELCGRIVKSILI